MTRSTEPAFQEARRAFAEAGKAAASLGRAADALRRHAPEIADDARRAMSEAMSFASSARETAEEQLSGLRDRGRDATDAAGDQMETAQALLVRGLRDRPAVIAAAALGVGFILGVVLMGRRS